MLLVEFRIYKQAIAPNNNLAICNEISSIVFNGNEDTLLHELWAQFDSLTSPVDNFAHSSN